MITDYILDLKDAMDAHYGAGAWNYRGATAGSGTDIGPAFSAMIATLRALPHGRGRIMIGPGRWQLSTSNIDFSGIQLEGVGSQASDIVVNISAGTAFRFSGANGYSGGGMKGLGLVLESGLGNTNAYCVYLAGDASHQPDQMAFEELYITSNNAASYWWDGVHCDGTARTSPQGIRVVTWKNIQVFCCRNVAFYCAGIVQHTFENIGSYVPLAGSNGADMYITGGGSPATNSIQVELRRVACGGTFHIYNASFITLQGNWAGLYNAGTITTITNS
jgi:hypothetical protein